MFASHAVVGGDRTSTLVSDIHYGYGLFIGRARGAPVIYHTGDNAGFKAISVWLPDNDLAVASLSNEESTDLENVISGILPKLL
jgi:hypothetical protein